MAFRLCPNSEAAIRVPQSVTVFTTCGPLRPSIWRRSRPMRQAQAGP
jgi:hypothetical protein